MHMCVYTYIYAQYVWRLVHIFVIWKLKTQTSANSFQSSSNNFSQFKFNCLRVYTFGLVILLQNKENLLIFQVFVNEKNFVRIKMKQIIALVLFAACLLPNGKRRIYLHIYITKCLHTSKCVTTTSSHVEKLHMTGCYISKPPAYWKHFYPQPLQWKIVISSTHRFWNALSGKGHC